VRPGEKAAAASVSASTPSPAAKPQPAGSSEKRRQSDLASGDVSSDKAKRACEAYDVDLAATEYGMCKCGFKKSDHVQSAAFRAAPRPLASAYHPESKPIEKKPVVLVDQRSASLASVPSVAAPEEEHGEDDGKHPCDAFDVDLLAKEFGTCKCGFKKSAHSKSAQLAQPKKPSGGSGFSSVQQAEKQAQEERRREQEEARRREEEEAREKREFEERERKIREMEQAHEHEEASTSAAPVTSKAAAPEQPASEGPKACDSFEIDLNAAEFGTCKCGFKKVEHTKTALFSKPLPKPVHAAAAIAVPTIPAVRSTNRAPPAFATSAKPSAPPPAPKPKPAEPVTAPVKRTEEAAVEEPAAIETEPVAEEVAEETIDTEAAATSTLLDPPQLYRALYDFSGEEAEDLNFSADETIEVLEILDAEWMRGRVGDRNGIFPSNFVTKIEDGDSIAAEVPAAEEEPTTAAQAEEPRQEQAEDEPVVEEQAAADEPVAEEAAAAVEEEPKVEVAPAEQEDAEAEQPAEAAASEPAVEAEEEPMQEIQPEETVEEVAIVEEGEKEVPFFATALFDFSGETEDDLNFHAGDRIEVLAIVDAEWWRGTVNGQMGIFPANFVTRGDAPAVTEEAAVPAEPEAAAPESVTAATAGSLGFVEALYDMEEAAEGDLPFKTGDRIEVLEILDDDWYRGLLNGVEGLVPKNYVSELNA
jgi:hypothetical protein